MTCFADSLFSSELADEMHGDGSGHQDGDEQQYAADVLQYV
jgi:hypothetical protein